MVFLSVESLERRVLVIDDGDDQLAVVGDAAPATDYIVALADVLVDHAVAGDFKSKYVVARAEGRGQRECFVVLEGLHGRAGGNPAG